MNIDDQIARIKSKVALHHLRLNSCLTHEEIIQFEHTHHISIPEDLKIFLLEIGNGGDGPPYYGVNQLSDMIPEISSIPFRPDLPFLLSETWIWEAENRDWWNDPSEIVQQICCHGNLFVGTEGCGDDWSLIVSGDQSGYMWSICDIGAHPTDPKQNFIDWYEAWLDRLDSDDELKERIEDKHIMDDLTPGSSAVIRGNICIIRHSL